MADWSIFESSPQDIATSETTWTEIRSKVVQLGNNFQQIHEGQIEISSSNNDAWYLLSDAYLEVRWQIARGSAAPTFPFPTPAGPPANFDANHTAITLVNHAWNLFSRAELAFSDNDSVDTVDEPGIVALTHAYAKYSGSRLAEAADNEFFYPEKANRIRGGFTDALNVGQATDVLGFANPYDVITTTPDAIGRALYLKKNESFARRFERTVSGKIVNVKLPLRTIFGYCDNLTHPIRGIPFSLILDRNQNWSQILHGIATTNDAPLNNNTADVFKAVILTCSLWVPTVKPSAEVAARIEQQLLSEREIMTKYVFENRNGFFSNVFAAAANFQQVEYKVQTSVARPSLILVGFQSELQFTSVRDQFALELALDPAQAEKVSPDPRIQHGCANFGLLSSALNDIQRVEVKLNNKQYPVNPYVMTFSELPASSNESWMRAYYDFASLFYKNYGENPKLIDVDTWRNAPIFAFKTDFESGLYDQAKSVDITIRATVLSRAKAAAADLVGGNNVALDSGNFRIWTVVYSDRELNLMAQAGRLVMYT